MNLEQFRQSVLELGLISPGELELFGAFNSEVDLPRFSQFLVQAGKLTSYQAAAIAQGKAKGLVIGDYLVRDKLGQGGMGVVFKVKRREGGKDLALKILPPSFGRDRDAVRRFRREFEVASRLDHPNVVRVLEADEDRGVQFLTMAYIEGNDLHRLVAELGPLPLDLGIDCAIQAAQGLAAAHAIGVVHRDVKPGNLMLDRSGTVRVLDLGLARVVEATGAFGQPLSGGLTQTATLLGTVDFLAPEQADDSKRADHRADIYSLGCTLYYLLTGKPPFGGDSVLKKLIAHREQPVPSLRGARRDAFDALDAVCSAMLAKNPDDRPATMAEVIRLLEACRSATEIGDSARKTLRGYSETMMKRAGPRRRRPDPDASAFDRREKPLGFQADPDLRIEDLVMDYREVVHNEPLPEEKLPPIPPRLVKGVGRRRSGRSMPLTGGILALAVFGGAAALLLLPIFQQKSLVKPTDKIPARSVSSAPEIPPPDPPAVRGEFAMIYGRPALVADYRETVVADGVIRPGEYGPAVEVDFTAGSQYGFLEFVQVSNRAPEDLSVRIQAAYSGRALFLAFDVRDQFVDGHEADRAKPYLNDCVEVFLDSDGVANDFSLKDPPNLLGSKEGFQLLVDASAHRLTVAKDITNEDWNASTQRTERGYVVEYEIPLALIDTKDGPELKPAGPGTLIGLGLAIDDNDTATAGKRAAFGFLRARPGLKSPFFGAEAAWAMGIFLRPKVSDQAWYPHQLKNIFDAMAVQHWENAVAMSDACPEAMRGWEWRYLRKLCERRISPMTPEAFQTASFPRNFFGTVVFSPDGRKVASGCLNQTVQIWEPKPAKSQGISIPGRNVYICGVAFAPTGPRLAAATTEGLYLINPETGNFFKVPQDHNGSVNAVAYSRDGGRIATGGDDKTVRIRELDGAGTIRVLDHPRAVADVRFSQDGSLIASACEDSIIRLWGADNGQLVRSFSGHASKVGALVFSPDGTGLVSKGADRSIIVWDVATGKKRLSLSLPADSRDGFALSPDGKRIAVSLADQTVRIWNAEDGRELLVLPGKMQHLNVTFSPDGTQLVGNGQNQPILTLWDAAPSR